MGAVHDFAFTLRQLIGPEGNAATIGQMCFRAIVIFICALIILRLGMQRFLGKNTVFDAVLAVILGSMLSRAINGSAPFLPTIVVGFLLIGLHAAISFLALRYHWFGNLVKGSYTVLVKDGKIRWPAMRRAAISQRDLEEALRLRGFASVEEVAEAMLERNGQISVIHRAGKKPHVDHVSMLD
jgi:uncharacterized membrane protein YcaP (DUF421 family)